VGRRTAETTNRKRPHPWCSNPRSPKPAVHLSKTLICSRFPRGRMSRRPQRRFVVENESLRQSRLSDRELTSSTDGRKLHSLKRSMSCRLKWLGLPASAHWSIGKSSNVSRSVIERSRDHQDRRSCRSPEIFAINSSRSFFKDNIDKKSLQRQRNVRNMTVSLFSMAAAGAGRLFYLPLVFLSLPGIIYITQYAARQALRSLIKDNRISRSCGASGVCPHTFEFGLSSLPAASEAPRSLRQRASTTTDIAS
jgi:hypothetical protein